jgi:hypothetical protein
MQELADALQGTKIVLVKILLTDLSLWLGGSVCIMQVSKSGVIHRGFSTYEKQSTEIFQNGKLLLNTKQIP